jgi:hypothetical protein
VWGGGAGKVTDRQLTPDTHTYSRLAVD